VRAKVQKEMETKRAAGIVGSSLQAEIEIQIPAKAKDIHDALDSLGDDLRFVLITSKARIVVAEEGRIFVTPSAAKKCERCWHYREDVGADAGHAQLCGRCVSNLFGEGEARSHA
jgi:isoleucyl-tRNA synthetase